MLEGQFYLHIQTDFSHHMKKIIATTFQQIAAAAFGFNRVKFGDNYKLVRHGTTLDLKYFFKISNTLLVYCN